LRSATCPRRRGHATLPHNRECSAMSRTERFLSTLVALFACESSLWAADPLEYNRDVRPILAENCFKCHGQDSVLRKAGLRLDQRDQAVEVRAIVPEKPDESKMIKRIFSEAEDRVMPPVKSNKKLTSAQKETLKRW